MRKLLLATLIFFLSATIWAAGVPYPGYVEVEDVDGLNAEKVPFDNTAAALPDNPDNVQDAIEKLDAAVDAVDSGTITDLDNLPGDDTDNDLIDGDIIQVATSTGPGVASFSNSFFQVAIDGVVTIVSGIYQAASSVLTDLATGSPTGTYDLSGAAITYGLESGDIPDLSGTYQAANEHLTDLADGSLPATKIQVADLDELFAASTVETALSELKGDISGLGGGHDALTLGATTSGLSLTDQVLQLALATNASPGAMSAAQVTALEAIDTEAELESVIGDAAADGSTKGVATFTATHFDASSGVISLDTTNGPDLFLDSCSLSPTGGTWDLSAVTLTLPAYTPAASATPGWTFNDSDGADGFINLNANDADDSVMTIGVDDSNGDDQTYVELDGVNEDIEFKYAVVAEEGVTVSTGKHITVGSNQWDNGSDKIDGAMIEDDGIDSAQYAAGSIDNEHLADDAVDSDEIASGAIDLDHMSAESIDSDQYVDGSIDAVHLAADVIDETKIADDGIDSEHYNDDSIDAAHISDFYGYDLLPMAWTTGGVSAPDALDSATRGPWEYRTFASDADEDVNFIWQIPSDATVGASANNFWYRVHYLIVNATGPSATEGVAFSLAGVCINDNGATNAAKGSAVTVTDDELNASQWDYMVTDWSSAVAITTASAGSMCEINLERTTADAVDDYGQDVGVAFIEIRYVKNPTR